MPSVEELLLRLRTEGFDEADAKLSAVQRRLRDLNRDSAQVKVSVDDAGVRARLAELSRTRHAEIKVDTDTSAVSAAFGRLKNDLSDMGQRASSLPRWLAATLPATIPLVGTLAQAAAGAGALGIAAGGAGTAFGVLGLAVKQSLAGAQTQQQAVTRAQQAVTRAEQAYQVTLQTGTRRQQQAAQQRVRAAEANLAATQRQANAESGAATQVISAWNAVKSTFASVMSAGVRETEQGMASILRAIRGDLPLLREPFRVLGGAVRDALTNPQIQAGLRQFVSTFGDIARASAPLAGPILRALIDIGQILANLARAAMPQLVSHVQRFVDWLDRMVGLTGDQDHMRSVIDRMVHSFDAVWRTVMQVAQALLPLFNTSSPVAQGMLGMISLVARLIGGFISLLNHLGPLGQIIGAGLGIALIIGRFRTLFSIIGGGVGLLGRLRGALFGVAEAEAAEGAASGGASPKNRDYAKSKREVSEAATVAAPAVQAVEGAVGAEGATAASRAGAQGGLVARLLSGLRSTLSRGGLVGGGAGALAGALGGGGALGGAFGGVTGALGGAGIGGLGLAAGGQLISAAISHWRGPITSAMRSAWSGAPAAARSALSTLTGTVNSAMRSGETAISRAGPTVRSLARTVWNGIGTAARGIPIVAAIAGVMRLGENAIRGHGGTVRSVARTVWNGISTAARGIPVVGTVAALMRLGEGAIRAAAGPVRSIASSVWRGISTAASGVGGLVSGAVRGVMSLGRSAVSSATGAVRSAASSVWNGIASAARSVGGAVTGAAHGVMSRGQGAVASHAGGVRSASGGVWGWITHTLSNVAGPVASTASSIISGAANRLSSGTGIVRSAMEAVGTAITGQFSSLISQAASAGASIVNSIANAISNAAPSLMGTMGGLLGDLTAMLPFSEPRDPSSPLRGLARAGRAIVTNIAAGISGGPVQQALGRAVALPALPNASIGHVPMPTMAGAGATASLAGQPVNINLNFDASVHPADPAVQRRIARTVSSALRTNLSQHPPVRA